MQILLDDRNTLHRCMKAFPMLMKLLLFCCNAAYRSLYALDLRQRALEVPALESAYSMHRTSKAL